MKKLKILACALSILMVGSLFSGCGSKATSTDTSTKTKKIVIGLSIPTQREERWVRDKETMEAEAKKEGVTLKVQVSDTDSAQQASQVENLISQGINVLILAPNDAAASAQSVEKAHAAGIKVISYDRLITNCDLDYYMSFDNVKVGELQGEFITKLVPKGNYIVMSGAATDNNAKLFKQGAMEYIKPLADKGDIKIVADQAVDNWEPTNALKIVENALTANKNNVQAILAPNDGTAGAAIQALAAQKLAGKVPITGQDSEVTAAQRIVQGTQSMTIFKDTRELGVQAIQNAIKLANGESIETNGKTNNGKMDVPSILLAPVVVTKDNIDQILINSGYLKKEDVYKK